MALLTEHRLLHQREEYRVTVHLHQVEQIAGHGAARRVDGLVRIGHRIHEGVEAAFDEPDQRVLDPEALRAAEHRVLQNMGNAG